MQTFMKSIHHQFTNMLTSFKLKRLPYFLLTQMYNVGKNRLVHFVPPWAFNMHLIEFLGFKKSFKNHKETCVRGLEDICEGSLGLLLHFYELFVLCLRKMLFEHWNCNVCCVFLQ